MDSPATEIEPSMVQVHCHGYGFWQLPGIHCIGDDPVGDLVGGNVEPFLMHLPDKLNLLLANERAAEIARFFVAWIHASMDFETALWNRSLDMRDDDDEEEFLSDNLATAIVIEDDLEIIEDAIFNTLHEHGR